MLLIQCPWCGERDQTEFSAHGQAHIARPLNTQELTDTQWGDYVFFRDNTKGVQCERWTHDYGCRRWFNAVRDTVSDQILATYKPSDPIPSCATDAVRSSEK